MHLPISALPALKDSRIRSKGYKIIEGRGQYGGDNECKELLHVVQDISALREGESFNGSRDKFSSETRNMDEENFERSQTTVCSMNNELCFKFKRY